jgi:hypothetical protein
MKPSAAYRYFFIETISAWGGGGGGGKKKNWFKAWGNCFLFWFFMQGEKK